MTAARGRSHGFTVWLTGLSGAGKTTLAEIVGAELERSGRLVDLLDGDVARTHLSRGLGFSRADRDLNVDRIAWVAARLTRHGAAVIVSAISPYADARLRARRRVEEVGSFVEVFVDTPLEECARRDVKALYARALAGEIGAFTGVSDPYEVPPAPDVRIATADEPPDVSARRLLDALAGLGLLEPAEAA